MKEESVKVLVVDDNYNLVEMVKDYFSDHEKISVKYTAYDGEEAIKKIEENKDSIDVILLDLIMPNKDGMYVLEWLNKNSINIPVIIGTSFGADETIARVSKYSPKHIALKPFNMMDIESKIIDAVSYRPDMDIKLSKSNSLEMSVTKILHDLGVPSHIKGYQYIREGVMLMYERPDIVGAITK